LVTAESTLGWLLSAGAFLVEMVEAIPVIGALIRWFRNIGTWLTWTVLSIPDAFLGLIGIRPEKKLRVCTVILLDEAGARTAEPSYAVALLQHAADLYKRDANIRLVPSRPFKYSTGFLGAESVTGDWVQIDSSPSGTDLLDPPCDGPGRIADLGLPGTNFQLKTSTLCFFGAWRRLSNYGAPVTCFIVRPVPGVAGCALWITDYATITGGPVPPLSPSILAHELGHASNLSHVCVDDDRTNLMAADDPCPNATNLQPDRFNTHLKLWQVLLVRASHHVTYF
jgi:hypothetical protein